MAQSGTLDFPQSSPSSHPHLSHNLSSSRLNEQVTEFVPTRSTTQQLQQQQKLQQNQQQNQQQQQSHMLIPSPPPPGMLQIYPSPPPPPPPPAEFHTVHSSVPMPSRMFPVHNHMPMRNHHCKQDVEAVVKKDQRKEHKDGATTSSKNGLSEEAALKILNQVEYYFSDFNLATTDHLTRFISKDPEGYVPISVVASFKKIKALITTHSQLARVLRNSMRLVVSEDGKKVRRHHPLTESHMEELQSRIIVAENLPEDHCHQNLMKIFSTVGSVKRIHTCHPQPSGGVVSSASRSAKSDCMHFSNKLHAFVEYESVELAEKAVAELNDNGNWRIGLRVCLMLRRAFKPAHAREKKGHYGEDHYEEDDASRSEQQSNEKQEDHPQLSDIYSQVYCGSRRAFQLVKNTITSSNNHLSSSSSGSIEAPRGCLRLLLCHSSSSSSSSSTTSTTTTTTSRKTPLNGNCSTTRTAQFISKTPKSAPISRLPHSKPFRIMNKKSSSKPISNKLDRVKKFQSSNKSTSETPAFLDSNNAAPVIESLSASQDLLKLSEESKELQFTPLAVSKIATCSTLDCIGAGIGNHKNRLLDDDKSNNSPSNTKTPPIEASFSPEIQSTTTAATTPACYGAGHLISKVTDKRKCRARGVLAVALPGPADNIMSSNIFNNVDREDFATGLVNKSSVSMLPLPAEASMHWLLSPCHEDSEDDKENSSPLHGLLEHKTLPSPSSPLSDLCCSLDWCNFSNNTSDANNSSTVKSPGNTNNLLISSQVPQFQVNLDPLCDYALVSSSPNATPYSKAVPLKEEAKHSYYIDGGNSPFSADTLGSENVMQTPKSDTSTERHVGVSSSSAEDHKRHHLHSELLSVAGDLQTASLSPESRLSIWDTNGSSFQFDRLTTPSNSVDLSQFQKILDDQSLWKSNSTFENVSQSRMRISWKEGLVSQSFELDEFDSCRCLSDEEEDLNVNSGEQFKSFQSLEMNADVGNVPTLTNAFGSTEFLDGEGKEKLHHPVQCSYAESISTDGGGLARSEDSDWNLCYKNNLFEA